MGDKPLDLIQGNQRGLGKTTLAQVAAIIRSGKHSRTVSYNPNDEEFEKTLASLVREGSTQIIVDNAKTSSRAPEISSAVLERSITDTTLNFRLLGKNECIKAPNCFHFTLTANSPRLNSDLMSRSLPINLYHEGDPSSLQFAIRDPKEYAQKYHREIRAELIGMVEIWKKKGMPLSRKEFRFRKYAQIIGGILEANGVDGFLDNLKGSESDFSSELCDLRDLVSGHPNLSGKPMVFAGHAVSLGLFKGEFQGRTGSGLCRVMAGILKRYIGREFQLDDGRTLVLVRDHDTHEKTDIFSLKERVDREASPDPRELEQAPRSDCGDAEIVGGSACKDTYDVSSLGRPLPTTNESLQVTESDTPAPSSDCYAREERVGWTNEF